MATVTQKEVLSRKEAAAYIGVCKSTLDRLNIPKIQIRRRVLFKRESIDEWLVAQQAKGEGTKA
jgi:excisionase family DNA binding protein